MSSITAPRSSESIYTSPAAVRHLSRTGTWTDDEDFIPRHLDGESAQLEVDDEEQVSSTETKTLQHRAKLVSSSRPDAACFRQAGADHEMGTASFDQQGQPSASIPVGFSHSSPGSSVRPTSMSLHPGEGPDYHQFRDFTGSSLQVPYNQPQIVQIPPLSLPASPSASSAQPPPWKEIAAKDTGYNLAGGNHARFRDSCGRVRTALSFQAAKAHRSRSGSPE